MNLEERIIDLFQRTGANALSDWQIADQLYPGFRKGSPANGAHIANIRRACYRSKRLAQLHNDGRRYCLLNVVSPELDLKSDPL